MNHLGKSELTGSAGYVTGKDKKNTIFPYFPRLISYIFFKWGKKQNEEVKIQNLTIKT